MPDEQQVWHSVTSCKAPCNRGSGIGYPLADGPIKFDSGQLGFGTFASAEVTTGSNSYTTPPLTKPGKTYIVLLPHPPVHARLDPGQGQAMIRRAIVPAIAVLLLVASAAFAKTETVEVGDDFFSPKKAKIQKNDRIAFDWIGTNEHDIVKVKGPGNFFESGPITGSGVEFKHKFKKAGDYKLICSIHENMTMKVEVKG